MGIDFDNAQEVKKSAICRREMHIFSGENLVAMVGNGTFAHNK